jgi:hypothetical protein
MFSDKVHPLTGHEGPDREQTYSSTLSLTLALDGDGLLMPCSHHLTPGNEAQYPLYWTLGGPQGQSEWVQKILPPVWFEPRTVQPIAFEGYIMVETFMQYLIHAI